MHVIYGRPLVGKTKRTIEEMNNSADSWLLISLESSERRGRCF